jgi:DNA polymerase-3 subunit alpha
LKNPGKGAVTLVVKGGAGEEVEIALPKKHQVTAALKDALRVIPGVAEVESV